MGKLARLVFTGPVIVMLVALSLCPATAQQVISATPGQTITYQGTGTPGAQVNIEISSSISTGVSGGYYISKMNGVNIPGGSSFSITASPVSSLSVTGSPTWAGGLGYSLQGTVTGSTGSASMGNVPAGSYNIVVAGASSASSVTLSVRASQKQTVGDDGTYLASVSTSGLPSAVYTVKQDGAVVAMVYLGVAPPATATPTVTPSPTSVPSVTPGPNTTITATPTATPGPTSAIWVSATPKPGNLFDLNLNDIFGIFVKSSATPTSTPSTPTPSAIASATGTVPPIPTKTPSATATSAGFNLTIILLAIITGMAIILLAAFILLLRRK